MLKLWTTMVRHGISYCCPKCALGIAIASPLVQGTSNLISSRSTEVLSNWSRRLDFCMAAGIYDSFQVYKKPTHLVSPMIMIMPKLRRSERSTACGPRARLRCPRLSRLPQQPTEPQKVCWHCPGACSHGHWDRFKIGWNMTEATLHWS